LFLAEYSLSEMNSFFKGLLRAYPFISSIYKEKTMKKVFLSLASLLVLGGAARGHEFFVMTDNKAYKSGDKVPLYVLSTHYFTVGEELEGLQYNKVWVRQGGRRTELALKENPDRLWYETEFTLQGDAPVIVEGNRVGGYTTRFTDGTSFAGTPAEAKRANPNKTVARASFLEKFSKTYVNPSTRDTAFSAPLGYTLEIVPLDNPAAFKPGATARFRVLYKGQPSRARKSLRSTTTTIIRP
jgi:uncharacterized GH25 family protein